MHTVKRLLMNPVLHAVAAAFLVSSIILMIIAHRPVEYTARLALLAAPASAGWVSTNSASDFSAVVAQSMAAIVEVAHSPSVLSKTSAAVPGAPSPDELFDAVTVELVPGSGVTRLSVRSSSPETARDLAVALAGEIVAKNVISPVGTFRLLDDQPEVRSVAPDHALATGLALAAGAAAAAAALGLSTVVRPSRRRRVERALSASGVTRPVAIVDGGDQMAAINEIDLLSAASGRPLRVVALTPSSARDAEKLSLELEAAGIRIADGEEDSREVPVVGVAAERDVSGGHLWAIAALPEPAQLIAVVVQ